MARNETGQDVPLEVEQAALQVSCLGGVQYVYEDGNYGGRCPVASIGCRASRRFKSKNYENFKVALPNGWVAFKSPSYTAAISSDQPSAPQRVSLDETLGALLRLTDLRWDLKQVFDMAVAEGFLLRNPAQLLFTPRECPRPARRIMTIEEVRKVFGVLEVREQLIARLAVLAGMRPGEIFALKWSRLEAQYADIRQRVYRGDIDSPKSSYSVRWAALSDGLLSAVAQWRSLALDSSPDAWVFPSERLTTPVRKDNCWRRHFAPQLKAVGLPWVNFQVMRRTHSCLLKELDVDPQVRAEQMGHTVDVNENVYTRTSLERRREAVNKLESALRVM